MTNLSDSHPASHARLATRPVDGEPSSVAGRDAFIRALVASAGPEVAADLNAMNIEQEADAALGMVREKPAGRHVIAWREAQLEIGGQRLATTVLEILNDDMPFLLASVLAEVRAHGLTARIVLHPIFKTSRREGGVLEAVTAVGDGAWNDGCQESYIALYLADSLDATARERVTAAVSQTLHLVRIAVEDWPAMLSRLDRAIGDLSAAPVHVARESLAEAIAFLEWLRAGQFTLLGMRDYRLEGDPETGELVAVEGQGRGVLRDPSVQVLRRGTELVALTPEVRRFFQDTQPLIITKSNVVSRVHRRTHMDYVGVKLFGADGRPAGELRIVGLLTSAAYTQSPRAIPVLRDKVNRVIATSGAPPESHDGKALLNVLETFPRDELFQIGVDDLARWAAGIRDLDLRPRVRVFARPDRFHRFVSALIFVPRDRFSTKVRERVQELLCDRWQGHLSAFTPHFTDGPLVRVHFIIGRRAGLTPQVDIEELERVIGEIVRTWEDRLADLLVGGVDPEPHLWARYAAAFSGAYTEAFTPERALEDIARIERLSAERPVGIDFYRDPQSEPHVVRVAIYQHGGPLRLSERVPVLENLGFTVVDERTYRIRPMAEDGPGESVLHDMILETSDGRALDVDRSGPELEACWLALAGGSTESDGFNRLIVAAGFDWRRVAVVRAYVTFLRQLGVAFGLRYIADTVVAHAGVLRDVMAMFEARFDPDRDPASRATETNQIATRIEVALADVQNLDEDRILRHLLALVSATVRTNFYACDAAGRPPETITFKFEGPKLAMAPAPRSYREIWVWSPRVEAVHLRFAPIARGGIRWSDRVQDFRTEVLGLAKAQQVKNAVIVPAGAKGGFIPKKLRRGGSRDEVQREGVAAYTVFVEAMLSVTDNLVAGSVVKPKRVVCHDGDDPYLVVAADKGTATFSDTANAISLAHGFWLGDAFASGGSAGYDHKRMAITSRGAWECVKRHFREMDIDIQRQPIRVVGVGDMSGDVFGNGVLQSRCLRLVAAFDHRDIFIDPDPDAEVSWGERKRLFDLPRSSWADYDRGKISQGGGVWSRNLKSIEPTPQMQKLFGLEPRALTPAELMRAILMCETDLLWFGGIGTFVRASTETDIDVGDRANDAIRVTGAELRAKVIGEGANLGVTQRARVEAAQRGIRLNTDFIDNSAGVNTSDQEVNIKIALQPVVQAGRLALPDRNALLGRMADDVARAVLRNNYQQSLAISLAEQRSLIDSGANVGLMRALEARGLLDRRLEALPTYTEMAERQRAGRGLTRPELAILSSYAKIALLHDLLASRVPDDVSMRFLLVDYFPPELQKTYPSEIEAHQLGREIIATTLTNGLVNRLGPAGPLRLSDEAARPVADTAYAFMAARSVFGLADVWARIEALDGVVHGSAQLDLNARVREHLTAAVAHYLHDGSASRDLAGVIARDSAAVAAVRVALETVAPQGAKRRVREIEAGFVAAGVPAGVAGDVAHLELVVDTPSIAAAARESGRPVADAAAAWLELGERFSIDRVGIAIRELHFVDDYDRLAVAGSRAALVEARRQLTRIALSSGKQAIGSYADHVSADASRVERAARDMAQIVDTGSITPSRLAVAAARLGDLARDAKASVGVD
jgi:glutamate dehydrogenase